MTISRIETFHVPPRWLFVRVETDNGHAGWGEASLEGHAEAVDGVFEVLRDRFLGHDEDAIEDIWQIAYRGGFYRGGPVLMSALSGLDQALWDLKGRAAGMPAWEMMGGRVREKVQAYAWIGGDRPDDIAEAAAARRKQGFSAVKMNATAEMGMIGTPVMLDDVVHRVKAAQSAGVEVGLDFFFFLCALKNWCISSRVLVETSALRVPHQYSPQTRRSEFKCLEMSFVPVRPNICLGSDIVLKT
jgi:galactonate dehydratase